MSAQSVKETLVFLDVVGAITPIRKTISSDWYSCKVNRRSSAGVVPIRPGDPISTRHNAASQLGFSWTGLDEDGDNHYYHHHPQQLLAPSSTLFIWASPFILPFNTILRLRWRLI